jgi:hypothetical protein
VIILFLRLSRTTCRERSSFPLCLVQATSGKALESLFSNGALIVPLLAEQLDLTPRFICAQVSEELLWELFVQAGPVGK